MNEKESLDDLKVSFMRDIGKIQDPSTHKYDCAVLIGAYDLVIEQIIFNCRLSERQMILDKRELNWTINRKKYRQ